MKGAATRGVFARCNPLFVAGGCVCLCSNVQLCFEISKQRRLCVDVDGDVGYQLLSDALGSSDAIGHSF